MAAKVSGYTRNLGIAIMMEHPVPGAGGRQDFYTEGVRRSLRLVVQLNKSDWVGVFEK